MHIMRTPCLYTYAYTSATYTYAYTSATGEHAQDDDHGRVGRHAQAARAGQ